MRCLLIFLFIFLFSVPAFIQEATSLEQSFKKANSNIKTTSINILTTTNWPYWRGPNRNGITEDKNWDPFALRDGAKILWKIRVANGYSAVTIQDDFLFTMGNENKKDIIYCLKAKTGEEVWRFKYDCSVKSYVGSFTTPVISEDKIYSFSRNGDVYCLNAKTGKEI